MSFLHITALILETLLGVFTLYTAYTLFAWTPPSLTKMREALHYPRWYWMLAGVMAAIGGVGLIAGLFLPSIAALAAVWMIGYFIVAMATHALRSDFGSLGMPALFGILFLGLMVLRWTDLTSVLSSLGI